MDTRGVIDGPCEIPPRLPVERKKRASAAKPVQYRKRKIQQTELHTQRMERAQRSGTDVEEHSGALSTSTADDLPTTLSSFQNSAALAQPMQK